MSTNLQVAGRFPDRLQAETAASMLESAGIVSLIEGDDAGGSYSGINLDPRGGLRLLVAAEDLPAAREMLGLMSAAIPEVDGSPSRFRPALWVLLVAILIAVLSIIGLIR